MSYRTLEFKNWQSHPRLAAIVKAAFPDYRRKRVVLKANPEGPTVVTLHGLNWAGGSRSEYRKVSFDAKTVVQLGDHIAHPANNRTEGEHHTVGVREAIVEAGTFCGKPAMARVYLDIGAFLVLEGPTP